MKTSVVLVCLCGLLWIAQGCSPNLGPLYRDYEVQAVDEDVYPKILAALEEAGWDTTAASAPNSVKTKNRTLNRWVIYHTVASLEVIPIGETYVRVLIHPYRHNFLRMRSKLPYIPSNIERKIVPDLTEALEAQGLYAPGAMPADSSGLKAEGS